MGSQQGSGSVLQCTPEYLIALYGGGLESQAGGSGLLEFNARGSCHSPSSSCLALGVGFPASDGAHWACKGLLPSASAWGLSAALPSPLPLCQLTLERAHLLCSNLQATGYGQGWEAAAAGDPALGDAPQKGAPDGEAAAAPGGTPEEREGCFLQRTGPRRKVKG